jgi:signal peptide peptidase SppA
MPPTKRRANVEALLEAPWALLPRTLSRIIDLVRQGPTALEIDGSTVVALDGAHDGAVRMGGVAVVPVYGVIEHREDWLMQYFGGCSVEGLRETLSAALADASVTAIVLDIDSPGGTVAGITEFAAEVRAARGGAKPIVAVANTLAASAAYWLASQADEIVCSPSGHVGSIGVYAIHQDISRMIDEMGVTMTLVSAGEHKTEGNEYEPLSDDARADIQGRVDATYGQFLADVAAGRRVTTADVEANYGGGRVLTAKKALAAGMVDRVESLGQTIQRLGKAGGRRRAIAAVADGPELEASDGETFRAEAPEEIEEAEVDEPEVPGQAPFTERVAALATEAAALATAAEHRARSRAAEHRPAFSTTTERELRASRDALTTLLDPGEPDPDEEPEQPGEPAVAGDPEPIAAPLTPPVAAPVQRRFRSDDEWLAYLQET